MITTLIAATATWAFSAGAIIGVVGRIYFCTVFLCVLGLTAAGFALGVLWTVR